MEPSCNRDKKVKKLPEPWIEMIENRNDMPMSVFDGVYILKQYPC